MIKYLVLLLVSFNVNAACVDESLPYVNMTPQQLRIIASNCVDEDDISMLYYNRAYQIEILSELKTLSILESRSAFEFIKPYHYFTMYPAITEELALVRIQNPKQRAIELNRMYDQLHEEAELHIKGWEHLIDYEN